MPAIDSPVRRALLTVLCYGEPLPAYRRGYVGWGTPGLFSMLNSVADQLLVHVYRGETVASPTTFYATTRLLGYSNVSLSAHFQPWSCSSVPPPSAERSIPSAVAQLQQESRYLVASHLLHLMFSPWLTHCEPDGPCTAMPARAGRANKRYDLAIHLRRGDKLVEGRNSERIAVWDEDQVVRETMTLLMPARAPRAPAHAPASSAASSVDATRGGDAAGSAPAHLHVLLASDDNAFAARVAARLVGALPHLHVERPRNRFDRGSTAPFDACDDACIPPLQELADGFARSSALMVSTKSNMGGFLLSWWAAANADGVPRLLDMDDKTKAAQLRRGRYFCALPWGARHGLCESNRTDRGGVPYDF